MATIEKRPSKGGTTYRVKIRVKDFPPITRSFSSSKEADAWARVGLATSAAQAGISSWKIRQQTGHKSEAILARYIRDGDLFANNAASLF